MVRVRPADADDHLGVVRVLDAGILDASAADVRRRIAAGTVLVAVGTETGRVVGTLVAVPRGTGVHVEALAVGPGRRGNGVGSALVRAAADRWGRLTARFDPGVRPFYESLGFAVEERGERLRGVLAGGGNRTR